MLSTTVILALAIAGCRGETCGVYDGKGNLLGDTPHGMGDVSRDADPGSLLPGELRFENVQLVSLKSADCFVGLDVDENLLRFKSGGGFGDGNACTLTLTVQADDGCPATTPVEYTLRYNIRGFVKDGYELQVTFPVPKGNKLSDVDIEVSGLSASTRIDLEEGFDGVEIVSVGSSRDGLARFQARATKLLYLLDDVNLTMIATDGIHIWKAPLTIRITEDSSVPTPEFEEMLYAVRLNASDFDSCKDVYPVGMIKLKEDYRRVSFDLRSVGSVGINFELVCEDATVGVRLSDAPPKNLSSQIITLLLVARVRNQFGQESEGVTTLLIGLNGKSKCEQFNSSIVCDTNDPEDLKIIVIVLSVIIVILIFVIIFLYFKYVCVKKPEPEIPCKKCSVPAPVKTRRPTPRKISEYPYPLDVMPPPLETLAETDVEEDGGERLEVKDTPSKDEPSAVPSASGVKTRKRSMTFRESDEESRHYREAQPEVIVHQVERKVSNESQRRISAEEERRRRKSSVKVYRCLT